MLCAGDFSRFVSFNYARFDLSPHSLSFCDVMALFVSEQVAWKIVEDDGEVIWMPYCAGRRKKGEEEEEEF